ncbi:MAG: hypothetical protein C4320_06210, partial [Armatimonadota bacterium]
MKFDADSEPGILSLTIRGTVVDGKLSSAEGKALLNLKGRVDDNGNISVTGKAVGRREAVLLGKLPPGKIAAPVVKDFSA